MSTRDIFRINFRPFAHHNRRLLRGGHIGDQAEGKLIGRAGRPGPAPLITRCRWDSPQKLLLCGVGFRLCFDVVVARAQRHIETKIKVKIRQPGKGHVGIAAGEIVGIVTVALR